MALVSKYDGKCKDCGTEYKVGDLIDTNGVKGDNGKDHWCPAGKNCRGAMTASGPTTPQTEPARRTAEELRKQYLAQYPEDGLLSKIENGERKGTEVIGIYIGVLEACESMGITNPITQGMIMNNVIRRME